MPGIILRERSRLAERRLETGESVWIPDRPDGQRRARGKDCRGLSIGEVFYAGPDGRIELHLSQRSCRGFELLPIEGEARGTGGILFRRSAREPFDLYEDRPSCGEDDCVVAIHWDEVEWE